MNVQLDSRIREWLNRYACEWDMPIGQVALAIRADEISNRLSVYPRIALALSRQPIDIDEFAEAARPCWVLSHWVAVIRFGELVRDADAAAGAIQELIGQFPKDDEEAIQRIDNSLNRIARLGYVIPSGSLDLAGAAQLISVILTSVYPKRFVDFRRGRWESLANTLRYETVPSSASYGKWLIWAGGFARDISQTNTFQEYWPEAKEPLWVIAGICWKNTEIEKPEPEPIDIDALSFPEGTEKRRLHLLRERNQTVVAKAKTLGLESDPLLRCQVCGFSFVETYGEIGRGFIEAHHKKPVAELTRGSRTHVSDIGLVCANCHRILHRGDRMCSIEKLRDSIHERRKAAS